MNTSEAKKSFFPWTTETSFALTSVTAIISALVGFTWFFVTEARDLKISQLKTDYQQGDLKSYAKGISDRVDSNRIAIETLNQKMDQGFSEIDQEFSEIDQEFSEIDVQLGKLIALVNTRIPNTNE